MNRLQLLRRLVSIQRVLVKYGLDELIGSSHLLRPARLLFRLSPSGWRGSQLDQPRGVRIRLAIEELGPIFVKFGQSLSTRQDLLPADIGRELTRLQDEVPPFPTEQALAEIESSFGQPASQLFASFEHEPLAAASIAQVHGARLRQRRGRGGENPAPGMCANSCAVIWKSCTRWHGSPNAGGRNHDACGRWTSSPSTKRPSSTSSTWCARPPTPHSCGATGWARR
jgi:predicted unusual protein kinase regulating ubiquinone biosynthesis (AarF/ABC1/UbiB family)